MSYGANDSCTVTCEQRDIVGRGTLDWTLAVDNETATLAWLASALEIARRQEQTKLVGYLEAVADDVVFEMESAARR